MSLDLSTSTAREIAAARQAEYVAFLHRVPYAADALALGFLPGFREDCGYQETQYQNLSLPVGMLGNDFQNPDLERFVDRFFEYEPQVGVIGDVDEIDDIAVDIDNTQSGEVNPTESPTKSSPSPVGSLVNIRRRIRWSC